MATETPTIAETIEDIQAALRDYIEATYHIGHPQIVDQRQKLLRQEGVLFKAPYIESTPRYQANRRFEDLDLDPAILELFTQLTQQGEGLNRLLYNPPYTHQAEALQQASRRGKSLAITTGTGSGKTESFLMPMLAKLATEAAHRPRSFEAPAVRALILYPMNALVNDQLGRLRLLMGDKRVTGQFHQWAGRPARFARYTSRTLYPGVRSPKKDSYRLSSIEDFYVLLIERASDPKATGHEQAKKLMQELKARGKWPAKPDLKAWYGKSGSWWQDPKTRKFLRAVTLPGDPELLTRHEVLDTPPDALVTNYSMLEYMLMRPLERPVFDHTRQWLADNPEEKFLLVVDEAHLYRGAAGAEVGLLLRRLRSRLKIPPERMQVITTSASFSDPEYAKAFAAQLSGKDTADFETVTSDLAWRDAAVAGTPSEAELLASVSLEEFYEAEDDSVRITALSGFLSNRGVQEQDQPPSLLLYQALSSYGPMNLLINETMKHAQPVHELGQAVFPGVEAHIADRAVTALVSLGSAARESSDAAGLLPCRVHAFFRGLPGLWACLDQDCEERGDQTEKKPIGKLFAQPRASCDCGARVFEYYTCRHCGSSYARGYTDSLDAPTFLWHEPGAAFRSAIESAPELDALDLLLEDPSPDADYVVKELDLVTGSIVNENEQDPERVRTVYLPKLRSGELVSSDNDDDAEGNAFEAKGEFVPCAVCKGRPIFGRSSVQDHQTKGDQPFQALISRQIEVQPPSAPYSDFAPLRGRKALVFSDSRQVAARLAPNLQTYSMRDAIRPLIIRGWTELAQKRSRTLHLERLYLAVVIGASRLKVRLRPELRQQESLESLRDVARLLHDGALDGDEDALEELLEFSAPPPQSLLRAMYSALTDRHYGLASLGLASLRERPSLTKRLLEKLPPIHGLAENDESRLALLRLWLSQWTVPGIWFGAMTADSIEQRGGVKSHKGMFRPFERLLNKVGAKRDFNDQWLPVLLEMFCEQTSDAKYRMLARNLALDLDGKWGYCERCRSTQRPFPGLDTCVSCGEDRIRLLDPPTDPVFRARKGYYRASAERALETSGKPIMSILAAEHTAQLNAAQADAVFSQAEEYELLFQDINVGLPRPGEQPRAAIDVLSCTTTMEVGIDIGSLSGVALRNMPPSRANYQQRAGRAGRRGNAVATVLSFGSADTHDDHYFRNPKEMIRGDVDDPSLTLNNEEIARRHITAYLLQRYHQDQLPSIKPEEQPQLFAVLGTVRDFVGTTADLTRNGFENWLVEKESILHKEIDDWLPSELSEENRFQLLDGIVEQTLKEIDRALPIDKEGKFSVRRESDVSTDVHGDEEISTPETADDLPTERRSQRNLLDRLLYKGVLPRYAFPTDVVSFHVFDREKSQPFRAEFKYEPSQGLPRALSQYAPGKTVWIDGKEWVSGALYAPVRKELDQAWAQRALYFECQVCHYAKYFDYQPERRGKYEECEACGAEEKFGPGMPWLRPTGFAHRVSDEPGTSPDDTPAASYATRAKLVAEGPGKQAWTGLTERLEQAYHRDTLLVANTGPRSEGYNYCTSCGVIEPTHGASGIVVGSHPKPYPDEKNPHCAGKFTTKGLVLGTDFITDVLLIRLKVERPLTLQPDLLSTQVALRTVAEAVTLAATQTLDIDANELQAEFRPALTPGGRHGLEAEIYMYDTLDGGAGFTRRVHQHEEAIYRTALERLENCPAGCDSSCYRCLRSFRNRFEHGLLDREVGAALLRYALDGTQPSISKAREEKALDMLLADLQSRELPNLEFAKYDSVKLPGGNSILAPLVVTAEGRTVLFYIQSPLTLDVPPNEELFEARNHFQVHSIDDMMVTRNLPAAVNKVLQLVK
ncbi:DEAD/DEAH box helicase [Nesterenkonia jeotgali]|uniref:ATP-dependent helicase YprA (DUF1998 family) n=1 Tax=Nesterenkonia jeotgali TaxID=317018 RepID=A0A839FLS4_9MICC|nr:DEAD/DEAH box helicase [Nesterenkonia jeotgali]MBA8920385.1 ATP-dependent helicase YprA (DUF1998 family) [Nesterenkonia jeotgali]